MQQKGILTWKKCPHENETPTVANKATTGWKKTHITQYIIYIERVTRTHISLSLSLQKTYVYIYRSIYIYILVATSKLLIRMTWPSGGTSRGTSCPVEQLWRLPKLPTCLKNREASQFMVLTTSTWTNGWNPQKKRFGSDETIRFGMIFS